MLNNKGNKARRIPKLYREASRILQKVKEEGGSVKTLVYGVRHPNLKAVYALVLETLKHGQQLDHLIRKTQILLKNPRLNPWVTRILMTELLWKKAFSAASPPQEIVLSYQEQFLSELANISKDEGRKDASSSADTAGQIRYIRVNTLKDTMENVVNWFITSGWEEVNLDSNNRNTFTKKAQNLHSYQFMRDPNIPDLLVFPHDFKFYETELYNQAVIILQDKASCVPAVLLNPLAGSVVLDMCAAPGMKTSQLAAVIDNKGKVNAVELHPRRYATLCETVQLSGATCVKTFNGDVLRHSGEDMPDVEYILLDPPCSGSGMLSRKEIFAEEGNKDEHRLAKLANFQCSLLRHAMTNFPNVKRIVYSTCSVYPEENEAVVDSVMKSIPPNFVPLRDPPFTDWMTKGSSDYELGSCGFYAYPSTHLTNGFFVITFDRSENDYVSSLKSLTNLSDSLEGDKNERKKKKKRKNLEEGKSDVQGEKKSSKPDDLVLKMLKAMQKPVPDQNESGTAAVECEENRTKKKKKHKRPKTNEDEDGSVNEPEQPAPCATIDDLDENPSKKTKKKKKKKSKHNDDESGSVNVTGQSIETESVEDRVDAEEACDVSSHCEKRKRKHSPGESGKKKIKN